ncbi:Gfo/Idh/MocA family oxidoreductase [Cellulomonas sp. ATA003]|uniref:Gfo/Idh/MocA family protein n=1 Tax=Cellulomonas sp. ATA003 TaxID=3073064 RepID=UPI00287380A5|nr:Gfo/Idh/MocA family oxidoreductase [Cellulomonas sp. ATA003]WNB86864.1 Gfo/Idh/MocA family oxidoreductase [Cellulomonas sp. ATA003]
MRVGVIGLGSIARKAYVPVLATTPGVTPVLVTRDPRTLADVGDAVRAADRFTSVDDAIDAGLDAALVHTPSSTHPAIAGALLRAGVPVLVDKPLATDAAAARALVDVAEAAGVTLTVGFNRRHAPAVTELAGWPDRDVVVLHKHRSHPLGPARDMVFDDFIHVVDTVRFLVPSPLADLRIQVRTADDGACRRVAVQFTGEGRLAIGIMSWTAGMSHELLDVVGDGRRRQVTDLADVVDLVDDERLVRRDGWAPATRLRGFDAMCAEFLGAVRDGRRMHATDALVTHDVCEQVVRAAEKAAQPA